MATRTIAIHGGDFVIEPEMEEKATATGQWAASTGLSNGVGFFSATKGGAAIDASLSKTLTARSGDTNRYYGVLDGADIEAQLPTYVNKTIWLCKRFGDSASDVDAEEWTPYIVTLYRETS